MLSYKRVAKQPSATCPNITVHAVAPPQIWTMMCWCKPPGEPLLCVPQTVYPAGWLLPQTPDWCGTCLKWSQLSKGRRPPPPHSRRRSPVNTQWRPLTASAGSEKALVWAEDKTLMRRRNRSVCCRLVPDKCCFVSLAGVRPLAVV